MGNTRPPKKGNSRDGRRHMHARIEESSLLCLTFIVLQGRGDGK